MTYPNPNPDPSDPAAFYSPPTAGLPVPVETPLVSIGDITVTQNTVIVPHGQFRLRGTAWTVQDSTLVTESIPAYAIVLAVLFFFLCFLGLLFLLIKERQFSGFISVTVVGDGLYHNVQLPAGPANSAWVAHQVNQARALAASAR